MDARRDTAVMPCGPKADVTSPPTTGLRVDRQL